MRKDHKADKTHGTASMSGRTAQMKGGSHSPQANGTGRNQKSVEGGQSGPRYSQGKKKSTYPNP